MNQLLLACILSTFLVCLPGQTQGFTPAIQVSNVRRPKFLQRPLRASAADDDASSFDMNELRQRIDQEYASYVPIGGASPMATTERRKQPDKVHVVVLQAGTMNQVAHTIEYPKGSGNNVVLAFESIEACRKFATSLQEQNFGCGFDPTPRQYRLDSLQSFFSSMGVFVQVIPEGVELKPPSQNVPKFGHNPSLCQTKKYLDYIFEMTSDDDDDDDDEDNMDEDVLGPPGAWE